MQLFASLVDQGKTILMVTHDPMLAKRAPRTITLANGELLNEFLVRALPTLNSRPAAGCNAPMFGDAVCTR